MIFILLILFVAGFFFPPVWLALAGYAIYIFASRKSRRDNAVEERVKKIVMAKRECAVFGDLHFEAARSYAIAKGAQSPEKDAASATVIVDGRSYSVTFIREVSGGTEIYVRDSRSVSIEIERDLQERLGNHRGFDRENSGTNVDNNPSKFVDSYFSLIDSIGEIRFDKGSKKPSWVHDKEKVNEFTSYLLKDSARLGIAETYTIGSSLQEEFLNLIFACVAAADSQGFSFEFQKDVGVSIIKRGWERLSEENKNKFRNTPLDADTVEAMSGLNGS